MRIVHLTPGAGESFYCENCLRDNATLSALRRTGHDVLMVPMYLPALQEGRDEVDEAPIFFGGINVFLQQKLALFRRTPRWLDRVLDAPWLLKAAARKAGMTSAKALGETTLSMLEGEQGRQAKELDRLCDYLADARPEVVTFSNALLIGTAREIRRRSGAAVVTAFQDEDGFLDGLPEPYRRQCWSALAERAAELDGRYAPTRYYAETMACRLDLSDGSVAVVPNGLETDGYEPANEPPSPPAIGFLAPLTADAGLDQLIEAFVEIRSRPGLGEVRLRVTGGQVPGADVLMDGIRKLIAGHGLTDAVDFVEEFGKPSRVRFLQSCSVLSVPTRRGEAWGQYLLEAQACGVPVVQPAHGSFPEILEATGGGVLCEPNDPADLAEQLAAVLSDPEGARRMGWAGRQAVLERFGVERAAEKLAEYLGTIMEGRSE